ncbi:ArdC family protein [Devosia sp.]|uniref:ArdC family protein n=1 Tax=Devosia sp. TaxID=1871048 RepID=UPI003F7084C2
MAAHPTGTPSRDLHSTITQHLIAAIERQPGQFTLPWRREGGALHLPTNAFTGNAYNGINILSLWVSAAQAGFPSPVWATYKQWTALGAQVRKGERSSLVAFYKQYTTDPNPDDAEDTGQRRVAKASFVFNAAQVTGLLTPSPLPAPPAPPSSPLERIQHADDFITATGANVRIGGDQAFFHRRDDYIQLPDPGRFTGTTTMSVSEAFYATATHELVHWSGAKHRLDRQFGDRFGDQAYAAEELVAEIGSAFLCAELAITQNVRPDHAQYLASWLKLLKSDSRAVFTAAARASEATTYLKAFSSPAAHAGKPDSIDSSAALDEAEAAT